jgi:cytidylate kinase
MSKSLIHGATAPNVEARIAAHVRAWEKIKAVPATSVETSPFVTISREYGCEGAGLGLRLVEILNDRCRPRIPWVAYDNELLDKVAQELNLRREIVDSLDGHRRNEMSELFDALLNLKIDEALVFRKLAEVIRTLAAHGHVVLTGRGGHLVTQDMKTALHVRLVAPREWRVHRYAHDHNLSERAAEAKIIEGEERRQRFLRTFFVQDPRHPFFHDLILDNARFNLAQLAEIVFAALSVRFGEKLVGN